MSDQAPDVEDEVPFSPDVAEIIDAALAVHHRLPEAQHVVDDLLAERRALVLRARELGVTGYRLAQVFNVSQTTIGNWSKNENGSWSQNN